jgi:hypothetical protein
MLLSHCRRECGLHSLAGGEVRDAAEEYGGFVLGVSVETVAPHDALPVSHLQCGVADAPVKGDMVENERMPRLVVGQLEVFLFLLVEECLRPLGCAPEPLARLNFYFVLLSNTSAKILTAPSMADS